MILAIGPASRYLFEKVAPLAGIESMMIEHKLFPDGESYLRFTKDVRGEDLLILQGMHPPQDRHLIQALFMAENAIDLGARSITLIAPYLAYARQDKRFLSGEVVSLKAVLKLLHGIGYKKIYTINIHSPWIAQESPVPLINLRAEKALAQHLKKLGLSGSFVVSMGKKGKDMASVVARELRSDYIAARSTRDKETGRVTVEMEKISAEKVVVVDDIISTGGTMASVIMELKKMGVKEVYAACIHALLVKGAVEKILSSGAKKIIASDTIPNSYAEYSVAGVIAEAVSREKG